MNKIISQIDAYINELSQPLSSEEIKYGWTNQLAQKWRLWFIALREKLQRGEIPPSTEINVAYGMGMDGIDPYSSLADRGAAVWSALRKMQMT